MPASMSDIQAVVHHARKAADAATELIDKMATPPKASDQYNVLKNAQAQVRDLEKFRDKVASALGIGMKFNYNTSIIEKAENVVRTRDNLLTTWHDLAAMLGVTAAKDYLTVSEVIKAVGLLQEQATRPETALETLRCALGLEKHGTVAEAVQKAHELHEQAERGVTAREAAHVANQERIARERDNAERVAMQKSTTIAELRHEVLELERKNALLNDSLCRSERSRVESVKAADAADRRLAETQVARQRERNHRAALAAKLTAALLERDQATEATKQCRREVERMEQVLEKRGHELTVVLAERDGARAKMNLNEESLARLEEYVRELEDRIHAELPKPYRPMPGETVWGQYPNTIGYGNYAGRWVEGKFWGARPVGTDAAGNLAGHVYLEIREYGQPRQSRVLESSLTPTLPLGAIVAGSPESGA